MYSFVDGFRAMLHTSPSCMCAHVLLELALCCSLAESSRYLTLRSRATGSTSAITGQDRRCLEELRREHKLAIESCSDCCQAVRLNSLARVEVESYLSSFNFAYSNHRLA